MYKVLTIAGSDCSGGAGIQADLKTIAAHKMYGMSAITALTAQNTTGVFGVLESTPEFVEAQIDAIFTDIVPDAVKIGMVSNSEIIKIIAKKMSEYKVSNLVIDPVMVSTSGSKLLSDDAMEALINHLLPLGMVITPNTIEAEVLSGIEISKKEDMVEAAKKISEQIGTAVLVKGGHLTDCKDDLLLENGECTWFLGETINNLNTHGTGCTLSSAIACGLASKQNLKDSIMCAKGYIEGALRANMNLGNGSGPLDHMYVLR
ncbi:MAG: bifunctional hydroxymethylpyrimidine kinase/phosphomethylpyrimidine kinase [Anaerovoracaceae bacterium]